jgi:hypothetical protein
MVLEKRISAVIAIRFSDPIECLLGRLMPEVRYPSGCISKVCHEIANHGMLREGDRKLFKTIFDSFMVRFDSDDAHYLEQALADMLFMVNEVVDMPRDDSSLGSVASASDDWVFLWVEGELDEIEDVVDAESDPRVSWNRSRLSRLVDGARSSFEEGGDISLCLRDAESDGREISSWLSDGFS